MRANFLRVFALIAAVSTSSSVVAQEPPELELNYGVSETEMLTIGYLDHGEGPVVLFYHPGVDARYWQRAIEAVAPSFRAIAYPVNASTPPAFSFVSEAFSLAAIIEGISSGLNVEPPHLVAHSFGGREALELAIARPDLMKSLTVIEPALAPDDESLALLRNAAAESDVTCPFADVPADRQTICRFNLFINEPGYYDNAPAGLLALAPQADAEGPPALEMLWPVELPPICDQLGELAMPILFIRGELTPEPVQASLNAYEACLPRHVSAVIADSAHYPFVYNPEAFNEALLGFLRAQ
jgi:pimeloyl-ACP methyl ester carboxylesterase